MLFCYNTFFEIFKLIKLKYNDQMSLLNINENLSKNANVYEAKKILLKNTYNNIVYIRSIVNAVDRKRGHMHKTIHVISRNPQFPR